MASTDSKQKILRIGVFQAGKVVEQRLLRKRNTISFGSDSKNTFILGGDSIPKNWPLFEIKGDQYHLVFSDDMDGHVSVDKTNVQFSGLKAQNLVEKKGNKYRLALNDASRGRVHLGDDLTIMFHFVTAPPLVVKPELPMAAKGGWIKSIEPIFTGVLAASFIGHALFSILIFNVEPPPPPTMDELKALIARVKAPEVVEEVPEPPQQNDGEDKKVAKKGGDKKKKEDAPKKSGEKSAGKQSAADRARSSEARRGDVRSKLAGKGMLALLGTSGAGAGGVADVFSEGSALGGISTDMTGTGGVGVAGGGGGGVTRRGGGGGGGGGGDAANIGDFGAGGGGKVKSGSKKKARIAPKLKVARISDVDGSIDKKGVSKILRRRQATFLQCYEAALKTNSKLKGKIVVEFTIGSNGRVVDASVVKDGLGSPQVSRCLVSALKRLRFPKPEDGEVVITNPFIFQPSS